MPLLTNQNRRDMHIPCIPKVIARTQRSQWCTVQNICIHCRWCAAIKASISPFAHLCIFVCNPVTQHSPLWSSIYSCLLFAAAFWAIDEFLILGCKSFVVAKVVKVGLRVRVWYISWRKAARRILLLQKFELERMWNHLFTFEHFLEHGQADKKRLFELNCIQLKSIIIFGPETYTCALFVLLKSTFGFKISQLIPSSPIWPTCSWWRVPRW